MIKKIERVKKWEIYKYRVSQQETEGTEIMKTRLGVIFSTDKLNKWGKRFVIIPLISKQIERMFDYEASVKVQGISGKALCDQIRTISATRLLEKRGILNDTERKEINNKISSLFDI